MTGVTVVIASIPGREGYRRQAVASAHAQDVPVDVVVEVDWRGEGPAVVRNRAVGRVETEWVAFLDDDDLLEPFHVRRLLEHATETSADVVYPWFTVIDRGGRANPRAGHVLENNGQAAFGVPFSADALQHTNYVPVTTLVRRSLFELVGGFPVPGSVEWPHPNCEDWGLWLRMVKVGAVFSHLPERTWRWRHHGINTSGEVARAARFYPRARMSFRSEGSLRP